MHELLKVPKEDLQESPDVAEQAKQEYQKEKYLKREGIDQSNILPDVSIAAPALEPRKRKKKKTELEKLLS